ncbi:hypothetical protein [Ekhidna sp.]|uniref:hypothetical protein n=1 Tax=Ekhidna sp. TaxID=2608089 RepID=UPI003C7E99A1
MSVGHSSYLNVTHHTRMQPRVIFIIILGIFVYIGYSNDYPRELVNLVLATALLGVQLFEVFQTRKKLRSSKSFEIRTTQWVGGLAFTGLLIYHFTGAPLNSLNIFAISILVITGIVNVVNNRTIKYLLQPSGIRNLTNNKFVDIDTITAINIQSDKLTVDTNKYQNELVIKASKLVNPSWDELTSELEKLHKNDG